MSKGNIIVGILTGLVVGGVAYFSGEASGKKKGRKEGEAVAKAKYAEQIKTMQKKLDAHLHTIHQREDFIRSIYAVGICCANSIGEISSKTIEDLEYVVFGITNTETLSQETKQKLKEMNSNPPTVATVLALIKLLGFNTPQYKPYFTSVVNIMASLVDKPSKRGEEFVQVWNTVMAAA